MLITKPSWRARLFSLGYRVLIRRRSWGRDDEAVARRARRLFGTPSPLQWLGTRRLLVEPAPDGVAGGERLTPKGGAARRGVVMYIHGGGYVSCSAATHRPITGALARLTGLRVFSAEYRLAPEYRFRHAVDDVFEAYRRLLLDQKSDGGGIALAGDSAGGGLVLALLVRIRDEGFALPSCAVCFSPWTDMTGSGASVRANDGRCAMFRPASIPQFATAYLGGESPTDPLASPVFADLGRLPPILLQVGSTELLLDDSRRVHKQIQAARGGRKPREASRLRVYKDVPHCWQMLDGFVPEARKALVEAAEFIRARVRA
ncbi:MAG: alpha/beta hydrolase [Acidobacteria bacterium]|nr:alpha/beta hydrolase [Acidobacteriota bacterium]